MPEENNIGEQPDVDMIQMALERSNPTGNPEPSGTGNEQAGQPEASQPQEPQPSTDQPPSAEGGQPPAGQPANDGNKGIDQIELAKTVASAVAAVNAEQNKAQQEKKPELTIEEANRILGKISITPEETRKIFSSETPFAVIRRPAASMAVWLSEDISSSWNLRNAFSLSSSPWSTYPSGESAIDRPSYG